ncbi:MAG: hypothetical protein ACFKPT_13855 [Gloeotrichia echinulata GP01]
MPLYNPIFSPIAANSFLIDELTDSVFSARGLRKLYGGYDGPCLAARNQLGIVADIPFDELGKVDINAVAALAGNGSTFVQTLYDQCGSAHASQLSPALQPLIYKDSAIINANGIPAISYRGQYLSGSIYGYYLPMHIMIVVLIPATTQGAFLKFGSISTGFGVGVGAGSWDAPGNQLVGQRRTTSWIPSISLDPNRTYLIEMYADSNVTINYVNGNPVATSTGTITAVGTFFVGGNSVRNPSCYICEDIVFSGIISSSARDKMISNICNAYGIF